MFHAMHILYEFDFIEILDIFYIKASLFDKLIELFMCFNLEWISG